MTIAVGTFFILGNCRAGSAWSQHRTSFGASQLQLRSLGSGRIVGQRKTGHSPAAGDLVAVLVPIVTTFEIDVVERRPVRFDGDVRFHEVGARISELEPEDAGLRML